MGFRCGILRHDRADVWAKGENVEAKIPARTDPIQPNLSAFQMDLSCKPYPINFQRRWRFQQRVGGRHYKSHATEFSPLWGFFHTDWRWKAFGQE